METQQIQETTVPEVVETKTEANQPHVFKIPNFKDVLIEQVKMELVKPNKLFH